MFVLAAAGGDTRASILNVVLISPLLTLQSSTSLRTVACLGTAGWRYLILYWLMIILTQSAVMSSSVMGMVCMLPSLDLIPLWICSDIFLICCSFF